MKRHETHEHDGKLTKILNDEVDNDDAGPYTQLFEILERTAVPEPEWEEEIGVSSSPADRERIVPWAEPMPEG